MTATATPPGAGAILCVVGARPNFMKIAPIHASLRRAGLPVRLLHTGQHYDADMSGSFFADLGIPPPDIDLGVGSASHAVQTATIMLGFEPVLDQARPAAVLVVGDVNSTVACALVAVKKGIPVVHVEAGLRSFDRAMPEEINRVLTDQISDLLFTTEPDAAANLRREGVAEDRIRFVGNVMIDALRANLARATPAAATLARVGAGPAFAAGRGFAVLTLHRPSNVDDPAVLGRLLTAVTQAADDFPVVFPVHPRTRARIAEAGLAGLIGGPRVLALPPLGYLDMLGLMAAAGLVLTDSGGIQEETTALGVPCLTLRENTERPITVTAGTNTVIGTDPDRLLALVAEIKATGGKAGRVPELWDGRAGDRIAAELESWLKRRGGSPA